MPQNWNVSEPGARLPDRHRSRRAIAVQVVSLLGLWLLFSGHYDVFHISAGVFSVTVILVLNRNLARVRLYPGDVHRELRFGRVFRYAGWLIKEIVRSALQLARIVLTPRMPVDPALLEFHAELPNAGSQVILGNSITLTPGTVTIDIDHGVFLVHAITDAAASSLVEGIMPARVAGLYVGDETGEVTDVALIRTLEE
jgi:multicomponent Na+:H+ antiporter subunit E